jgi:6-pyruvoyltetrahydropterin/6-carboxytetrahydropterin synthase
MVGAQKQHASSTHWKDKMSDQSIAILHNAEAAHRLFTTPGKCERIHGHSFQILVQMFGPVDEHGMVCGLDFGAVKKVFRNHIDTDYDHHLLLNEFDPFAGEMQVVGDGFLQNLPGVQPMPGDPTTENIAKWIGQFMVEQYKDYGITSLTCSVQETKVNGASWDWNA